MNLYVAVQKENNEFSSANEVNIGVLNSYPTSKYSFQVSKSTAKIEPSDIFEFWKDNSGATNWSELIETKLLFYRDNLLTQKMNFECYAVQTSDSQKTINFYVGDKLHGYSIKWFSISGTSGWEEETSELVKAFIFLGSEYQNANNIPNLLNTMRVLCENKFKNKIYDEQMDDIVHSPLIFAYTINESDSYYRMFTSRNTLYKGLPDYSNWYTFFTGGYTYGDPITLKLAFPINDINEIILSIPVTPIGTIDNGYDNEYTFTYNDQQENDLITSFLYVSRGTDLKYLFELNNNNDILLNNGILKREIISSSYPNFSPKYSIITNGESFIQSYFNIGSYRTQFISSQWLIVNPDFVTKTPDTWISKIDENYSNFIFRASPISFIGEIFSYNTNIVKLPYYNSEELSETEPSNLRCVIVNYINTLNPDTYYLIKSAYIEPSNISFNFWKVLLEGNYPKEEFNIGSGSIGGGNSTTGGNDGKYDDTSSSITGSEATGVEQIEYLFTMYKMDATNLALLSADISDISEQIINRKDIMPFIISLKKMFLPSEIPTVGTETNLYIANTYLERAKGTPVSRQFARYKLGEYNFERYYGNYLDFSPYTKISLYLPFAEIVEIDPSLFYDGKMILYGNVDLLSGTIVYEIVLNKDGNENTIDSYSGVNSFEIPLTADDYSNRVDAFRNARMGTLSSLISILPSLASGGFPAAAVAAGSAAISAVNSFSNASNTSVRPSRSGNLQGFLSANLPKMPFLIFDRPKMSLPETFANEKGFPSNISVNLGSLKGYTIVDSVHLNNIPATDTELAEIESLLKNGVIF